MILKSTGHHAHAVASVKSILLAGIETPDPVYFCTVEAPSETSNVKFEKVRKLNSYFFISLNSLLVEQNL